MSRCKIQSEGSSHESLESGDEAEAPMALGGKLAGLSLSRQVLALALWPFLQNLLGVGVGFADMMIAGRMESGPEGVAVMDMMGARTVYYTHLTLPTTPYV